MKREQRTEQETGLGLVQPKFHMHEVLVRFRPQLTRAQQQRLLTDSVIQILSDPICFIRDNYHEQNWCQILPLIQQSYCRRFFLMGIGSSSIIKQISMIKFCCLKQIDLSSNKIDNIQLIQMIKLPHIKSIVLRNNYITRIGTLRRGKWRDIEEINLQGNRFVEYGRVNEICAAMTSNVVDTIDIGFYSQYTISSVQDVGFLYAKMMTNMQNANIMRNIKLFEKGDLHHQQEQQVLFRVGNQNNNQQQIQRNTIIPMSGRRISAIRRKFQKPIIR